MTPEERAWYDSWGLCDYRVCPGCKPCQAVTRRKVENQWRCRDHKDYPTKKR